MTVSLFFSKKKGRINGKEPGYGTQRTQWRTGYCGCTNNTIEIIPSVMYNRDKGYRMIANSTQAIYCTVAFPQITSLVSQSFGKVVYKCFHGIDKNDYMFQYASFSNTNFLHSHVDKRQSAVKRNVRSRHR